MLLLGGVLSFLAHEATSAQAETWYVNSFVAQQGDGRSWQTAFRTIQDGIDAASDGHTVVVAQGTYVENIQFKGRNILLTSRKPLDPNVVTNTIIDGGQIAPVVSFAGSESPTCTLSGFTIRNGRGGEYGKYGGGIYGSGTLATIRNNRIINNRAPST
jgi:hypothetical protein